ncbi:MAG: porin [Hyphomicrobiales bacterium]|nr:porin [Hyphomicrobiales bacterium]
MVLNKHMMVLAASAIFIGGSALAPAKAADIGGGDCCAELDDRIAELESTAVRKGNRKVSLSVTGFVARELYIWDDGDLSDAYIVDTSTTLGTHFKFSGKAQVKPGLEAGFVQHIEVLTSESIFVDQANDEGRGSRLNTLEAYWFLNSDRFGRLAVGQQSQASDNAAILPDFSGSLVQSNWVLFDGASFFLRPEGGPKGTAGLETNRIGSLGFCNQIGAGIGADCNGLPTDSVRYDTPAFGGFIFSTSWGENDFFDAAIRYSGEWNSVKFKAAAAYSWGGDRGSVDIDSGAATISSSPDSEYFQIGAMAMHTPTGLFLYGAYGQETVEDAFIGTGGGTFQAVDDNDHYFVKAGLRKQWSPMGHTVLYGEYGQYNDAFGGFNCDNTVGGTAISNACTGGVEITGSEIQRIGLGVVQEIDSAAMSVWAKWVQLESEVEFNDAGAGGKQDYESLNSFLVGAMISF